MTPSTIVRRAALAAALVSVIGASVAWAHGNPDQVNDPATDSGWYCHQDGPDQLFQGFVPTRRQLSSFDARVFKGPDFPESGMTLTGRVHVGTGIGPVVGTATASLSYDGPDELLAHFEFSPPVVLEPQGMFVFELLHPASGISWMGRNDNPYGAASAFDCRGAAPDPALDFNFLSYAPADTGAPETALSPSRPASVTKSRRAVVEFSATDDLTYAANLVLRCELDGSAHEPCVSPVSLAGLADGRHTFSVSATDQAGLTDATPASVSWTVDGTAPSRPLVVGPRRPSSARATYRFSARDSVDRAGQLKFRCGLDSSRLRPCGQRITRMLTKGRHVLRVVAVDRAGNVSRVALVQITRS